MLKMKAITMAAVAVGLFAGLTGCAPKELPPTARPPLQATDVKLYTTVPQEYENHGIIFSQEVKNPPDDWRADVWIDQLKAEAAAKGANGLLIVPSDKWKEYEGRDDRYVYVGGYYGKQFFVFPVTSEKPRKLIGRAIFVVKE